MILIDRGIFVPTNESIWYIGGEGARRKCLVYEYNDGLYINITTAAPHSTAYKNLYPVVQNLDHEGHIVYTERVNCDVLEIKHQSYVAKMRDSKDNIGGDFSWALKDE